jgi:hypothetical protein
MARASAMEPSDETASLTQPFAGLFERLGSAFSHAVSHPCETPLDVLSHGRPRIPHRMVENPPESATGPIYGSEG